MTNQSAEFRVPLAVADKLEAVRKRAWKVRVATAFVGGMVVLLAAMGLAMAIDRWATLYNPAWRSMLTLLALGATGITLVLWILAAWRYVNRVDRVAADVDRSVPKLEERWSTIAQLSTPEKTRDIHPAMYRQVADEANKYSSQVDPLAVVRLNGFTRAAWCLTAVTAILIGAAVMDSHRTAVLFKRFWLPMANISATEIHPVAQTGVVARGESLEIAAELAGTPVHEATLILAPETEDEQTITLVPRGDEQNKLSHRVRAVTEPLKYRLRAGDGQTDWQEVAVADRPELAAATLTVIPPEYTQQEPQEFDKLPRRLSALMGSQLKFAFKPRQSIAKLQLDLADGKSETLLMDADGWYRWNLELKENVSLSPILEEEHGLTNRRPPQCSIQARPDKPPIVRIITPNEEMAVRPDDKVPVTFEAKDDVRVGSAELVIYDESNKGGNGPRVLDTIPIPLGEQEGQKEVKATVELDLNKYKVINGAELSFAVRVREDRSLMPVGAMPGVPQQPTDAQQSAAGATASQGKPQTGEMMPRDELAATIGEMSDQEVTAATQAAQDMKPQADATAELNVPEGTTGAASPNGESGSMAQERTESMVAAASGEGADDVPAKPQAGGDSAAENVAAKSEASGDSVDAAAAPSEPSALSQAIAKAIPDTLKELAARDAAGSATNDSTAPTSDNSSATASNSANPSADADSANKETTSDRRALNMATNESAQPQLGETASGNQDGRVAQGAQQPQGGQSQPSPSNGGNPSEQVAQGESQSGPTDAASQPTQPNNGMQPEQMAGDPQASQPQDGNPSNSTNPQTGQPQQSDQSQTGQPQNAQAQQQRGNQSQQMASDQSSQPQMAAGSTPPPRSGATNQLDAQPPSQSSTSNRMRLKIDEWAGSFAGQEREALEMAIAPELLKLDELLEKAEKLSRSALDAVDAGSGWLPEHGRDIDSAGQQIAAGMQIIDDLEQRTHGTPYAFVGLQLVNVNKAHLQPARREFWKSLQTDGDVRVTATRNGWQHTVRSREMLAALTSKFETARQENALAETVEKVKKMYQVFVENSMALLSPDENEANNPIRRKRVEFDIDDEYMTRLKEVIEMRNKMRAELAKILADDPRLLRRFLDSQQNRRRVLRNELQQMIESQQELNREVQAWSEMDEANKAELQAMLLQRHAETSADLAVDAAVLQDKFDTWLPLTQEVNNADVQTATHLLQEVATATQELSADAETFIAQNQAAKIKEPIEDGAAETSEAEPAAAEIRVENIASAARALHDQLTNLEVALRQLGTQEDRADLAVFAANRLVETRDLITLTSEWLRQLKHHQDGNYHNAAEVEQYRLARQTDSLAGKLASIEQQMAGLLQRTDNKIPEELAVKSRELLASLDEQAAPNQLSAVYSLRRNQIDKAVERQESALAGIENAAKNYDELLRMAIEELDKLPVQDPIASLLQDPTLDELLAELEQEFPIEELLGIPARPSNLRIVGDFTRMGGDNALSTGATRRMMMNQLLQRQRMRQRRLDQSYRRAVARALQEIEEDPVEEELEIARETVDWNVLLSQLGDDLQQGADKAPPERYRRAIEQYFRQISQPEKATPRD
jgi:hypothetical protein